MLTDFICIFRTCCFYKKWPQPVQELFICWCWLVLLVVALSVMLIVHIQDDLARCIFHPDVRCPFICEDTQSTLHTSVHSLHPVYFILLSRCPRRSVLWCNIKVCCMMEFYWKADCQLYQILNCINSGDLLPGLPRSLSALLPPPHPELNHTTS